MNISISASLLNQVPLANDPPNSSSITSEYFLISFSTKLKAISAISFFDLFVIFEGITVLEILEII